MNESTLLTARCGGHIPGQGLRDLEHNFPTVELKSLVSLDTGFFCRPGKERFWEIGNKPTGRNQLTVPGRLEDWQAWLLEDIVDRRTDRQAGTS